MIEFMMSEWDLKSDCNPSEWGKSGLLNWILGQAIFLVILKRKGKRKKRGEGKGKGEERKRKEGREEKGRERKDLWSMAEYATLA